MTSARTTRTAAGGGEASTPADAGELAELLSHTARRLRRGSAAALAPLGLTHAQGRVLRVVAQRPRRMADIAAELDVVPRTVTSMIDDLEAAGLVSRRADPADRRSVIVELTAHGRKLTDRIHAVRRSSAEAVFAVMEPADREQLQVFLEQLCTAAGCCPCGNGGHC
ncbi:MAG: MarR family winged helix-turn-helix transcriptional regulator [Acidimicrobiales bacterium]